MAGIKDKVVAITGASSGMRGCQDCEFLGSYRRQISRSLVSWSTTSPSD